MFEDQLRCFDRLRRSVAWPGLDSSSVATAAMPAATVAANARVAGHGVARAVRAEMASRAMSETRMASSVVSANEMSAAGRVPNAEEGRVPEGDSEMETPSVVSADEMSVAGVVPNAVGRRVPDGDSEVPAADDVMACPVVSACPVPQGRVPEVRKTIVPVIRDVVSTRIETRRDVHDAIAPGATRFHSLQQISDDLFADGALSE